MPEPRPTPPHCESAAVVVAGHDCELLVPESSPAGRAIIFLHDLDGRGLDALPWLREPLAAAGLPVIAPRTGRSWWLDHVIPEFDPQLTPERFVVDAVVAELARRFDVRPPGIALLGVGMGGQGALRLAYRHPAILPVAAALAPAIDFHQGMRQAAERDDGALFDTLWNLYGDVERARQDTAILHVHPLNWPRHQWFASSPDDFHWHDGAQRLHGKLVALGIPHEAVLEPVAGEPGAAFARRMASAAVAFVVAALDKESRRIP